MVLPNLHRALDALAMWSEERVAREPEGYRPAPPAPLACFDPLGSLPPAPTAVPGRWSPPSPLASGDPACERMSVLCSGARGAPRGTAILVPPWKTTRPGLVGGYRRLLERSGHDVWIVVPPHHLDRTAEGARSGEGFVSLDIARLRRVFEQLVAEIRICAAVARERGPVGVLGLSLGAHAAALAATAPERLDFAALVAPPDLPTIIAETRIGRRYRELARRAGAPLPDDGEVRQLLEPLDPARRPPTARRLFVAAGGYDIIVPHSAPVALARAWGVEPKLYPRGHMTLLFLCRALRRDLARFVAG